MSRTVALTGHCSYSSGLAFYVLFTGILLRNTSLSYYSKVLCAHLKDITEENANSILLREENSTARSS